MTLLGFDGVILGLLPASFSLAATASTPTHYTWQIKATLVAGLVLLVLSAGCCLRVISLRTVTAPSIDQLRSQWHTYATGGSRDLVLAQMAHAYLGADPKCDPLGRAAGEATSRAAWFGRALWLLVAALMFLAVLTAQILVQRA